MSDDIFSPELLEGLEDGAYCVDKSRRIVSWNEAAEKLTGYCAEEAVGNRCWHNLLRHVDDHGRQLCRGWCPLVATMQDGVPREARVYLHHRDGHRVPVQVHARPLRSDDGEIIGAIETFTAVEAPLADEPAEQTDGVVGTAGVSSMGVRVDRWLEAVRRSGRAFGVVRLRIDARERVGTAFDIETSEAIIKAVGATINHAVRAGDVSARIDDEEFLVLLPDCDEASLVEQGRRLRFLVEQTFLVKNRRLVRVHVLAGTALAGPEDSVEELIGRAADNVLGAH
jgi:PAS domain S-box-containing protein/diguanylate cyclase (GGDEF)-like protein